MTSFNVIQPILTAQQAANQMHEEIQHSQNVINDKRAVLASKNDKSLLIHKENINKLNANELAAKEDLNSTNKIQSTYSAQVDNLYQLQEV